jgi:hypothetical protein
VFGTCNKKTQNKLRMSDRMKPATGAGFMAMGRAAGRQDAAKKSIEKSAAGRMG